MKANERAAKRSPGDWLPRAHITDDSETLPTYADEGLPYVPQAEPGLSVTRQMEIDASLARLTERK